MSDTVIQQRFSIRGLLRSVGFKKPKLPWGETIPYSRYVLFGLLSGTITLACIDLFLPDEFNLFTTICYYIIVIAWHVSATGIGIPLRSKYMFAFDLVLSLFIIYGAIVYSQDYKDDNDSAGIFLLGCAFYLFCMSMTLIAFTIGSMFKGGPPSAT